MTNCDSGSVSVWTNLDSGSVGVLILQESRGGQTDFAGWLRDEKAWGGRWQVRADVGTTYIHTSTEDGGLSPANL